MNSGMNLDVQSSCTAFPGIFPDLPLLLVGI